MRRTSADVGQSIAALPVEHPARIFGGKGGNPVERGEIVRGQFHLGRGEIVEQLLLGPGADDDGCHMRLVKQPGERDARHQRAGDGLVAVVDILVGGMQECERGAYAMREAGGPGG